MARYLDHNPIIILVTIISSFLASTCLANPVYSITSCLIEHHVANFSLNPKSAIHNQYSNSTSYYKSLFFSLQNLRFTSPRYPKPVVIILPSSKEQLVKSFLCTKEGGYEVRIRSGGHSYEGLSSTNDDGIPFVLIDLMNLDRVLVDLRSKTAWVEAGATVGQVYYAIANQSKGVYGFTAALCYTVGSGGHFAGGGVGLLSRKYGVAADNVVDAIMVDAKGQVLDRATMGEDVFWAIRGGGGGSFGIVYAWKIKLLKVPSIVTVIEAPREGQIGDISQLVHKWQYVGPYLNDNFYLMANLGPMGNNSTVISTSFFGLYIGRNFKAISILNKKFPELRLRQDECKETSWLGSYVYLSPGLSKGSTIDDLNMRYLENKNYFKQKSDYVTTTIPLNGIIGVMEMLTKEPNGSLTFEPYGGQMSRISSDSLPFPHRKGNLFSILYTISWEKDDDKNRDKYIGWIRGVHKFMTPFVSSNPRAAYVNYLDLDLGGRETEVGTGPDAVEKGRVWGQKYFLNNYDRLVKAKSMIDPYNFFRHPQGIPSNHVGSNYNCSNQ